MRPARIHATIRSPRALIATAGVNAPADETRVALPNRPPAGRSIVDPRIVELLLDAQRRRDNSRFDTLTPREQEILGLVAEGLNNGAIAERIVITKRAVERHINSIFSKLGLGESEGFSRRVKAALLYLAGQAG